MSGSDLRNLCSRCVSECRGGKLASPSRARAEQCGYLARGTSASVRSVTAGCVPHWPTSGTKKGDRKRSARSPPRGAPATSQQSTNFSPPGRALKSSANLNGWIARKPFANLRRTTRARGSERHAEWDIRKPVKACRCWRSGGVSRRRQHERQASAHAPDVRPELLSEANTKKLRTT